MLAVARMEGLPALWSGLVPGLLMQLPSTALYFTAYDELKERLEQGARARARRGGGAGEATPAVGPTLLAVSALAGKDGEFAPLISGVLSRTLTVTLVSPLELLRTKAMYKGGGGRSAGGGMGESVRAELKAGGVASLWRGLGPTLARDVPFSGIYWYGYERIKKRATTAYLAAEGGGGGGAPPPAPPLEISAGANWAVSFVAGLISGSVAAVLTTPFDVVKTRKQVQLYAARASGGGGGGGGGGVAGGTAVGTAAPALPTSIPAIMRTIFREEGLRGLFAGVQMRLARVGPACALMISSYEVGKRVFGNGGGAAGAELAVAAVLDE
jgi:solute carrier family 25, member 39/40